MSQPKAHAGHASMPRFIVWVQDHLLLTFLMVASGYINGLMLCEGWVPNIEDPRTWGIFHGIGLALLFAAGGAMGGLTVRVGYKLSECVQNRQGGRAVFLAFGLAALSLIEFWASFSQRAPNLHPTAADSLLPWPPFAFSFTAILIAAVLPFTSLFWGFTAEDPAPKAVEDAATVEARMQNKLLEAQYKARINATRARGLRGAVAGALGQDEAPQDAPVLGDEAPAFADENTDATGELTTAAPLAEPPALDIKFRGKWWDAASFKAYVLFAFNRVISLDDALVYVRQVGKEARAMELRGHPFIATRQALKTFAKKTWGDPLPRAIAGDMVGQFSE